MPPGRYNNGSAPPPGSDLVGIGEAARLLGVSADVIRNREREGALTSERTAGGHRRYRRSEVERLAQAREIKNRPPGQRSTREVAERMLLTADQEAECLRIAEAAATLWAQRVLAVDWDEAFSDAMLGVSLALARPSPDVAWNVSCWNHAQWEVLKGIRKRTGINSRRWAAGVRGQEDLPPEFRQPVSYEAALESGAPVARATSFEEDRILTRMELEHLVSRLGRLYRVALVNAVAHQFTDREIAAELDLRPQDVAAFRSSAVRILQEAA